MKQGWSRHLLEATRRDIRYRCRVVRTRLERAGRGWIMGCPVWVMLGCLAFILKAIGSH